MDRLLRESGVDFEKVNYYIEPLSKKQLTELIRKMKITPRELLRTSEPIYRELGLAKGDFSDAELISLMIEHPDLIQRPIVERGNRRRMFVAPRRCFRPEHALHAQLAGERRCSDCHQYENLHQLFLPASQMVAAMMRSVNCGSGK